MPAYYDKAFADAARALRQHVPLGVPVTVQTVATIPSGLLADCTPYLLEGKLAGFRLRVKRGQSLNAAIDCLIHEYAHALDHEQQPNTRLDHRESWGRCYAKCYQAVKGKH